MMRWLVAVCLLGSACERDVVGPDPGNNLIFITLDGVRTIEAFGPPDPRLAPAEDPTTLVYRRMHEALATSGVVFGDPAQQDLMLVNNAAQVSVPGYMAMFTGYEQTCRDNDCPQVPIETVFEYVQRMRAFPRGQVAAFASWEKMTRVLQQVPGTIVASIGERSPEGPLWAGRWDTETFALAMDYLETRRPRLLYIALLDGDGWGHLIDYPHHLAAQRQYDAWIEEVRTRLAGMGDYGARTTLIVTTDHGRGYFPAEWPEHHAGLEGSQYVWLYADGPHVAREHAPTSQPHTTGDIRPTVEAFFGIEPSECLRCGHPLVEIVPGVP